jgi:uncharacterized protein (DUF1499 family)
VRLEKQSKVRWFYGLIRNRAELRPDAADPGLRPVVVPRPRGEAMAWAAEVIAALPRWTVVAVDAAAGTLHATHATRLWRFIDDIHLRFAADPQGTRITGRSKSRIGSGDLGQNARNLRELVRALEANR